MFRLVFSQKEKLIVTEEKPIKENPITMAVAPNAFYGEDSEKFGFDKTLTTGEDYNLDTSHPDFIRFQRGEIIVEVIGGVKDIVLSSLRITLKVFQKGSTSPLDIYRSSQLNLFDEGQLGYAITRISERLGLESLIIKDTLYELTERLEQYRRNRGKTEARIIPISTEYQKEALNLLQSEEPLKAIEEQFKKAGASDTRLALQLYILSLSRLGNQPLHGLLQAPRLLAYDLIKELLPCLPKEKTREATTISKHALSYPPTEDYWNESILILHQCDGLNTKDNSLLDYILHGQSKRLVTQSNAQTGLYESTSKELSSTISLIGYTDKDYNPLQESRDLLYIPVQNTEAIQSKRYEREVKRLAGYLNQKAETKAQETLQQVHREIEFFAIQNPLIEEVDLSAFFGQDIKSLSQYLRLVNLITLVHQHKGSVFLTPSSKMMEVKPKYMIMALELFRELWLKKDEELYFKVRTTFSQVKEYLTRTHGAKAKDSEFTLKEIRKTLKIAPITVQRHLHTLEDYGKVERCGGNNRIGYQYRIGEWEESTKTVSAYSKLLQNLLAL